MKILISLLILGIGVSHASAINVNEALFINLNPHGLDLLAKEIKNTELGPINNEPLPNHEDKASGVKVKMEGMSYTTHFGDLKFVPLQGAVGVSLDVQHVRLNVAKARFTKKVIVNISSTCHNTAIEVNGGRVDGQLQMSVKNGQLSLNAPVLNFPIAEQNYKVIGPEKCSGFLVGGLIKKFVHNALKKSRETIEKRLNEQMRKVIPSFEKNLNELVRKEVPIEIHDLIPLSARQIELATYPHAVKLSPSGLAFTLGVGLSRQTLGSTEGFEFSPLDSMTQVGETGVNPRVLNEVFKKLVAELPDWQELTENLVPGVGEVLTAQNLSAIWPDLNTIPLSSGHLKAFIGFSEAPQFDVSEREALLKLALPLKLMFQIEQEGQWRPYFELKLRVDVSTKLDIKDNKLSIGLDNDILVTVAGDWDVNYTPNNPMFEAEMAEVVFASLLEYLSASGPFVNLDLPKLKLGGKKVLIQAPFVKKPYLRVQLTAF